MTFKVKQSADDVKVVYGSHEQFVISAGLLSIIQEVSASLDQSTSDYKDALVRETKERIGNNARLILELAVYARVVVGIRPRDLTHITCGIGPREGREYRAICLHVAKQERKLAGVH